MPQYAFGTGNLIGKRTDVASTPLLLGVLTDCSIDFDRKIEFLVGQNNMAVAAGGGEFKITGKAKYARFQASAINNLFLGPNVGVVSAGTMFELAGPETHTVVSGGFTVTNSGGFIEDQGLYYSSGGLPLTSVATAPTEGQYEYTSGGSYLVNSGDNGAAINAFYTYSSAVTGAAETTIINALMGAVPAFEIVFRETFTNPQGVTKDVVLKLNACVSSKLSMPFSNQKFTIQEFDFQAIADQNGNIGTLSLTEF